MSFGKFLVLNLYFLFAFTHQPANAIIGAPSNHQVLFSEPRHGDVDFSIHERVTELIHSAQPGSKAYINLYEMSYLPAAQAIVEARNRGVDIRLIIDRKTKGLGVYDVLREGFNNFPGLASKKVCPQKNCLIVCGSFFSGACIGTKNNHNKFYLFEELSDGRQWVTVQSSANLTRGTAWNDLIEISNNQELFATYHTYWQDSAGKNEQESYPHNHQGSETEAYYSPQERGDVYLDLLDRVSCLGGGEILLSHSRFTNKRVAVAKKLKALKDQGCQVQALAMLNPSKGSPGEKIRFTLGSSLTVIDEDMHNKIMLIDASFDGVSQKIVVTGSHNLNKNSLRNNDEALLVLKNPTTYQVYHDYWKRMESYLNRE